MSQIIVELQYRLRHLLCGNTHQLLNDTLVKSVNELRFGLGEVLHRHLLDSEILEAFDDLCVAKHRVSNTSSLHCDTRSSKLCYLRCW